MSLAVRELIKSKEELSQTEGLLTTGMTLHGSWGSCSVVITGERRQLLWAVRICWELCLSQSGLGALRVQILGWLLFGVQKWKEMSVTKVTFVSNDFCLLGLLPSVKLTQGRQLCLWLLSPVMEDQMLSDSVSKCAIQLGGVGGQAVVITTVAVAQWGASA